MLEMEPAFEGFNTTRPFTCKYIHLCCLQFLSSLTLCSGQKQKIHHRSLHSGTAINLLDFHNVFSDSCMDSVSCRLLTVMRMVCMKIVHGARKHITFHNSPSVSAYPPTNSFINIKYTGKYNPFSKICNTNRKVQSIILNCIKWRLLCALFLDLTFICTTHWSTPCEIKHTSISVFCRLTNLQQQNNWRLCADSAAVLLGQALLLSFLLSSPQDKGVYFDSEIRFYSHLWMLLQTPGHCGCLGKLKR